MPDIWKVLDKRQLDGESEYGHKKSNTQLTHSTVVASQIPWACAVELICISHRLTSQVLYGVCICVSDYDTLHRNLIALSHILSAVAAVQSPIWTKLCLLLNRLQVTWINLKPLCRHLQSAHATYSRFLTFYKSEIKYFTCIIRTGLSISYYRAADTQEVSTTEFGTRFIQYQEVFWTACARGWLWECI